MGRIITSVTVGNFSEPEREIRFDALIDAGAYCLTLPRAWKERLGALSVSRSVELVTADRRVLNGEICGPVMIRIASPLPTERVLDAPAATVPTTRKTTGVVVVAPAASSARTA